MFQLVKTRGKICMLIIYENYSTCLRQNIIISVRNFRFKILLTCSCIYRRLHSTENHLKCIFRNMNVINIFLLSKVGWFAEESSPLCLTTTSRRSSLCPPLRLVNMEVGSTSKAEHMIITMYQMTVWKCDNVKGIACNEPTGNSHLNLQLYRVL